MPSNGAGSSDSIGASTLSSRLREAVAGLPDDAQLTLSVRQIREWMDEAVDERPADPHGNGAHESAESAGDELLDVEDVAEILNVTTRYVYDHADDWPFTRRLSPRKLRFSEQGLYRWLESRP